MTITKYKNPPIEEAVFDLQIRRGETAFDQRLNQQFLEKIQPQYSFQDKMQNVNINAQDMTQKTELIGYRYRSAEQKEILQFKKTGFSFSRLKPYDGWEKNYKEMLRLWKIYCEVMNPNTITRAAVRFISKFQIPNVFAQPKEYFNTCIQYDDSISPSWNQMAYRLLLSHGDGIKSHIVFDNNVIQSNQGVDVLFDIDVFFDDLALPFKDNNVKLDNIFQQLRKIKNNIFEKSITDKIRDLIK